MTSAFGPGFAVAFGAAPTVLTIPPVSPSASDAFPDVEWLITLHLRRQFAASAVTVVTELPLELEDRLPMIRVLGAGGHDDRITSRERVDVESFHATRGQARELAEQVRTAMRAASHTVIEGWLIDLVHTEAGPIWLDYQNENVRRYLGTYLVLTRVRSTR